MRMENLVLNSKQLFQFLLITGNKFMKEVKFNDLEYQFIQLKNEVKKFKNKKILITGGLGFLDLIFKFLII